MNRADPHNSPIIRLAMLLCGVLMLVTAPFMILKAFAVFQEQRASVYWPSVEGTITRSEVLREVDFNSTTYSAIVEYSFEVEGKKYQGDRVTNNDTSSQDSTFVNATVRSYPAGSKHLVSYEPARPENCVLETGVQPFTYILAIIGIGCIPAGLMLVRISRKRSQDSPDLEVQVHPYAYVMMVKLRLTQGDVQNTTIQLVACHDVAEGLGVNVEIVPAENAESLIVINTEEGTELVADQRSAEQLRGKTIHWHGDESTGYFYAN